MSPVIKTELKGTHLRRLLSGLLGLVAAGLPLGGGLGGELGSADGRDTLDGGLTEVGTVAVLGGEVGNSLVGAGGRRKKLVSWFGTSTPRAAARATERNRTHLRADLPPW